MKSPRSRTTAPAAIVLFLFLIGCLLRIYYIGNDYYNPDEAVAKGVVQQLQSPGNWDTNWEKANVPTGFRYPQYNFSSYHYTLYFWDKISRFLANGIDQQIRWRFLNTLWGMVSMVCVYLATKEIAGSVGGIVALGWIAVMPLLVQDAHYIRCEAMLTAGCASLLVFSVPFVLGTGRPRGNYLGVFLSGLVLGWMVSCKSTMLPTFAFIPLALVYWHLQPPHPNAWPYLVLVSLGAVLGFAAGVPFGIVAPRQYLSGILELHRQYAEAYLPYSAPSTRQSFGQASQYFFQTLGAGSVICGVAGAFSLFRQYRVVMLTAFLAPIAAFWVLFGVHPLFTERSLSPIIPFAALLIGAGSQFLFIRLKKAPLGARVTLYTAFAAMLFWTPTTLSWKIVFHGFSGQEQQAQQLAIDACKAMIPDARIGVTRLYREEEYQAAASEICLHRPIVIAVCDYHDVYTPVWMARLQNKFDGRVISKRESIFPDLPVCTLYTYISPRIWFVYFPAIAIDKN